MPAALLCRSQLARLLRLLMALRSNGHPNARDLADLCGVSRRTVYRDLEALEQAGVPVRYRPDRQGYALAAGFAFTPPRLEEDEALALVALARGGSGGDGRALARPAREALHKVLQALPDEARTRAFALDDRLRGRPDRGPVEPDRAALHAAVLRALASGRQIRVRYEAPGEPGPVLTKLSPYHLLTDRGVWCLVARSSVHRGVRVFRLPWIDRVEETTDAYAVPPRFRVDRFLGLAWSVERGVRRFEVRLRFSAPAAREARASCDHPTRRLVPLSDGRLDLLLTLDGLDEVLGWALGFGAEVEVLSPPELRDSVRRTAARIAQIHAPAGLCERQLYAGS